MYRNKSDSARVKSQTCVHVCCLVQPIDRAQKKNLACRSLLTLSYVMLSWLCTAFGMSTATLSSTLRVLRYRSFPSFGYGFDSRRPLQNLNELSHSCVFHDYSLFPNPRKSWFDTAKLTVFRSRSRFTKSRAICVWSSLLTSLSENCCQRLKLAELRLWIQYRPTTVRLNWNARLRSSGASGCGRSLVQIRPPQPKFLLFQLLRRPSEFVFTLTNA